MPGSKVKACTLPGGTLTSEAGASGSSRSSSRAIPLPERSSSSWCILCILCSLCSISLDFSEDYNNLLRALAT